MIVHEVFPVADLDPIIDMMWEWRNGNRDRLKSDPTVLTHGSASSILASHATSNRNASISMYIEFFIL